jgi:hypothetical protein
MAARGLGPIYLTIRSVVLSCIERIVTEEDSMVELTVSAKTQLDGYFAEKEKTPIRIYLSNGG